MAVGKAYSVEVEGVGLFEFRRRAYQDAIRVEAEMVRMLGGALSTEGLIREARKLAELKVLTVRAPAGWDVDEIDPFDQEETDRLDQVWEAFRKAEETFRTARAAERATARA